VKGTGYPRHSPVSPSLPLPCVTVCDHISTGVLLYIYSLLSGFVVWTGANLPYLSLLISTSRTICFESMVLCQGLRVLIIIEVFKSMSAYNIAHLLKRPQFM